MDYKVSLTILSKKRNGETKTDSTICLGEMSMPTARTYVGNLIKNNSDKTFVVTYEESLFAQQDTCDNNCADCPSAETCPNSLFNP